jgi:Uma2 family endonuclease
MSKVEHTATYEDIIALPEHLVGELIDGELFVSPRPSGRHERAAGRIYMRLRAAFDDGVGGPGGWWIVFEPELRLGDDALVPDVAGWRRETMPIFPDAASFTIAPDWICEVTSPPRTRLDRIKKLPRYAFHGVEHAWIVDPAARTLEVYQARGEVYSLIAAHEGDEVVRAAPFEAMELRLADVWLPTPPDPQSSR